MNFDKYDDKYAVADMQSRIRDFKFLFYREFERQGYELRENQGQGLLREFESHLEHFSIGLDYSSKDSIIKSLNYFCAGENHTERKAKNFLRVYKARPPKTYLFYRAFKGEGRKYEHFFKNRTFFDIVLIDKPNELSIFEKMLLREFERLEIQELRNFRQVIGIEIKTA